MNDKPRTMALDDEYLSRVLARMEEGTGTARSASRAWYLARSGEEHFTRLDFALRRLRRAQALNDEGSIKYEREVVSALLYEIADTAYLVLAMLDFNQLELSSSEDGLGFVGEVAPDVVRTLNLLNNQSSRLLEVEKSTGSVVDFSAAVDEREGITYLKKCHWQDMVPGSLKESFYTYFRQARASVLKRLAQKPDFWSSQTVEQYLHGKRHTALLAVLKRLSNEALDN